MKVASPSFTTLLLLSALALSTNGSAAQPADQGRWADDNDPVAKHLIEQEQLWSTDSCVPNSVIVDLVADDFVGTSPRGTLYTKSDMLPKTATPPAPPQEHDCKLISARLRYYTADVAVIYGRESAVIRGPDGSETTRILAWTDTAVKRNGRWQLVAVEDLAVPAK